MLTHGDPAAEGVDTPGPAAVAAADRLGQALTTLRTAVAEISYPLALPSAAAARVSSAALIAQLDDYLLPRLARLDAPLLVVVGGSTGAGKSTLVNSLVSAPVSAAGVLRPTTRAPVLVCHPADAPWFSRPNLLPGLTRTGGGGHPMTPTRSMPNAHDLASSPHTLQIVSAPALIPGLALLDAPDIDSVVDANRALALQLLAAADLWLFVTTAARYADAVPWGSLATARERGTAIALVLDRMPPDGVAEISDHFTQMLTAHGFGGATLFAVPEVPIDGQGLLPERVIGPLRDWLATLARDAAARSAVIRQTVAGAVAAAGPQVALLAYAAEDQVAAGAVLDDRVRAAYRNAQDTVEHGVRDGALLRGEVLARWQEFVGTGELFAALQARLGRLRDRVAAAVTGRPAPGAELATALESSLVTLLRGAAADAAEQAYVGWRAHPAGEALLADARAERFRTPRHLAVDAQPTDLSRPSTDLGERAERLVRDWQRGVLDLVRQEGAEKRTTARAAAYAVNATGVLVMIGVFASTAFIPTGAELAVGAGTTIAAQKVLEAVFGDQAIRSLAGKARADLLERVQVLLDAEAERYLDRLADIGLTDEPSVRPRDDEPAARLRAAAAQVVTAAAAADLVPEHSAAEPQPAREPTVATPADESTVADEPMPADEPTADDATVDQSTVDGSDGPVDTDDKSRKAAAA